MTEQEKASYEQENLEKRNTPRKVHAHMLYRCPQCFNTLCYEEDIRERFCPKCGQRLDWSEI